MTSLFINPGSGEIPLSGQGWTNTYEVAYAEAQKWLERMHDEGFSDVELLHGIPEPREGRWRFVFRHRVTLTRVELEVPGIDNLEAYQAEYLFAPRVYWKGSSSGDPELEDFGSEGYEPVRTFRRKAR